MSAYIHLSLRRTVSPSSSLPALRPIRPTCITDRTGSSPGIRTRSPAPSPTTQRYSHAAQEADAAGAATRSNLDPPLDDGRTSPFTRHPRERNGRRAARAMVSSSVVTWSAFVSAAAPRGPPPPHPPLPAASPRRVLSGTAGAVGGGGDPPPVVDLRSDTVTRPSRAMIECALTAPTGDDVMGEDPTVVELEDEAARVLGKSRGLFVPTGTMGNLCAVMAHCHGRGGSEIIIGSNSHISLYEGGNAATIASVHTRQIPEDVRSATIPIDSIRDAYRSDDDDHYARTAAVCLENTHNILGGVAVPSDYVDSVGDLCRRLGGDGGGGGGREGGGVKLHVDGARLFNSAISLGVDPATLCRSADSVTVCLSKGLGAPLGSVLVSDDAEFVRLARRARKRLGGGMRQAGVVAAMGLHALRNNVGRLADDHRRAGAFAGELERNGFEVMNGGRVDTNIVFFAFPPTPREEEARRGGEAEVLRALVGRRNDVVCRKMEADHGVKLGGGYGVDGGRWFRACTHMDVDDEGMCRAIESLVATAGSL